jgi:hypothetical protein
MDSISRTQIQPNSFNIMYKKRNASYLKFAESNRKSVGVGQAIVPALVELKKDLKSKSGTSYNFLVVSTLNRKPLFVQFAQVKDENNAHVPFEPPMKRVQLETKVVKTEPVKMESVKMEPVKSKSEPVKSEPGKSKSVSEPVKSKLEPGKSGTVKSELVKPEVSYEMVPEHGDVVKQNGQYGVTILPNSRLMITSFDRNGCASVGSGATVKLALVADMYGGRITFKASDVTVEGADITREAFNKYYAGSQLAVVPTKDNIDPDSFPADTESKFITRSFVLPVSGDTSEFKDVEILVDPEDARRFSGKNKDEETLYPCVNTEVSTDKNQNSMSVVYTGLDDQKYFMKFAFTPQCWTCFGVTDVAKWTKCAGRMMFSAVNWFALGSSKLDNILSMRTNVDDDDDGNDYGLADYDMTEESSAPVAADMGTMVATTGFVSKMSVDLSKTVQRAGVELSGEWVAARFGTEGSYSFNPETPPSGINSGWRARLQRGGKFVFNVTEFTDDIRPAFFREAKSIKDVKFFGIFAVGDDQVYEFAGPGPLEARLDEKKLIPSLVFAIR